MRPIYVLACLTLLSAAPAPAHAHFLFIHIGPPADGDRTVEVYFSESARAGDPAFIDRIAHTRLWVQTTPGQFQELKVHEGDDRLTAPLNTTGDCSVVGECEYGVIARANQVPFLLRHFPKAIAGHPAELNRLKPRREIRYEILPTVQDHSISLVAIHQGKPVPNAVFTAIDDDLKGSEFSAGSDGRATWKPPAPGRYSIYTRHDSKERGELRGKPYGEIREFATIAFTWPLDRTDSAGWPQFRGVNATAAAVSDRHKLPHELDPEKNVIFKTPLPPGHSSPVIVGNRLFLTAVDGNSLLTIAVDRISGKVLWQAEAPHATKEVVHRIGSYAQPTPAADGDVVVSFFGSSGLLCYNHDGKLLWHLPMGPFNDDYGAGSSPILADDRILINQDHDTDSFLMAVDKRTGTVLWKADRSEFPRNYATPVVWHVAGKKQIVVPATLRVVGYDFDTGGEIWTVRGLSRIVIMTPTVGPDGTLYVAGWAPGGDETERIDVMPYTAFAGTYDKNGDGSFDESEFPEGPVRQRFRQFDRDKTGLVSKEEYESMRGIFEAAHNVIVAIKPGGTGDITETHVLWKYGKLLPYCPSPVFANDLIFMVKDGGIVSCLDAKTGRPTKQGRVSATAGYYSSPVAGDGKIYLLSQRGELTVITADRQWRELSSTSLNEDAFATPAIVDGRIYVRTAAHLYCFGGAGEPSTH